VTGERIRIDKWLWHTRLCKTRALAGRLCEAGAVDIDGATIGRAAHPVKIGTMVTIRHAGSERRLAVLGLGTRRGPAPEARLLYAETEPPRRLAAEAPAWDPLLVLEDEPD
jgi:ribosome-associated heat shock protein Hsp15